jgi:hypothetical protein
VAAQELTSGGVLIEVSDNGVGVPETRLAEMNWRLDNPPVMDVSVSRHMGLFAVARLAERHGVRVRLRPRTPHGLTALVWLPDSATEREASLYGARSRTFAAQAGFPSRGSTATAAMPARSVPDAQPANHRRDVIVPEPAATGPRETVSAGAAASSGGAVSDWFRSRPSSAMGNGNGNGNGSAGLAAASTPPSTGTLPTALPATTLPTAGPLPTAPLPTAGLPNVRGQFSGPSGSDGWAVGKHAAQIIAEPVRGDFTAAGLPTRVPQANLIPGSAGGGRTSGSGSTGRPGPGPEAQTPASPRSPDVARSRLSGFQRGVRRAKDLTPDSGEGTDS